MKRIDFRSLLGLGLILLGGLYLLQTTHIIKSAFGWVWAALFAISSLIFLYYFITNRETWWAAIPGFTLLGLASVIGLSLLFPRLDGEVVGAIFLGSIAVAFWAVLISQPSFWWAVIPAGAISSVAAMTALSIVIRADDAVAAILFLGLALTFAVVGFMPTQQGRMRWAFIPAGILFVFGLGLLSAAAEVINYVWPALIIAAGVFFLYRSFMRKA